MTALENKIDFAVIMSVDNANPNGDPLDANRPRETSDGLGEMTDVCLKRKIRNRLQDMGERIFVQSEDRSDDGYRSLRERAEANDELKDARKRKDRVAFAEIACETWIDVRSFGQVFAFSNDKGKKNGEGEDGKSDKSGEGLSVGVRGPVSIQSAFSIEPITIDDIQITKSVNNEEGDKKGSDTMGMKYRVSHGIYVCYGSINCQLAGKTGFSEDDAEKIHSALCTLFENDMSSARPEGSMEVCRVYWWKHSCPSGQYSPAKVHRSLVVAPSKEYPFFTATVTPLEGLEPTVYENE